MKKGYKKIIIFVIVIVAVGAVAVGSNFLLKENEKDKKVEEITCNAIDSMNSAICSAINAVHDYEKSLDALWMSKEEFGAATGLTGEKLDEYFGYYMAGKDGGDNPEDALNVLMQIAIENEDIVTPSSSDNSGNDSAEVADNSKPGSAGNNNSGGNGNSGSGNGGNGNSGSSSSNNETNTQNQNSTGNESGLTDEEADQALADAFNSGTSGGYTPLTEEQQQAEEEAWASMNGY